MDKKFLNKVVSQIVSETKIDHYRYYVHSPFAPPYTSLIFLQNPPVFLSPLSFVPDLFIKHCENVYGLNKSEIEYVWNEYKQIIKEKLNNGL